MSPTWEFRELQDGVQGRGTVEDNFAPEARTGLEILMREALQNSLDARVPNATEPVRVVLKHLQVGTFDATYLKGLITDQYIKRWEAASGTEWDSHVEKKGVLLLEDFTTTGLRGQFNDARVDGPEENWNAFWFREGEGAKGGSGSNGRAGQGKITYYRMGAARAVFGLTRRQSDGRALLMGRSSLRRTYWFNDKKYERDAFWCRVAEGGTSKIRPTIEEIDLLAFQKAFALERTTQTGLSLVIPFPGEFDIDEAVPTAISEFYYPIAAGRLVVTIGNQTLTRDNIDHLADSLFPDDLAHKKKSSFTKGYRGFIRGIIDNYGDPVKLGAGWEKSASLTEAAFPEGSLAQLRASIDEQKRISVRFPVTVRPKKNGPKPTWFDVHLEVPDGLEIPEEAYIRRELLIGSETQLAASPHLPKARGLTLIQDEPISGFLADAEEPTHLKWNASRPLLSEEYASPRDVVRSVRQALPRLLALISGGMQKKDTKALARYFTKPSDASTKSTPGGSTKNGRKIDPPPPPPPPPTPKPFRIETGSDWVSVQPTGPNKLTAEDLPLACRLEIAYEGLDQDAFAEYDPFDFELGDKAVHLIDSSGVALLNRKANAVEFQVLDPSFVLKVNGFDPNIRLRARLTYKEENDGENIGAE